MARIRGVEADAAADVEARAAKPPRAEARGALMPDEVVSIVRFTAPPLGLQARHRAQSA